MVMCIKFGNNKIELVKVIDPCDTIELGVMAAILQDKMEEMGMKSWAGKIHLPDSANKIYKKEDVMNSQSLEEIDKLAYITEEHDCDDFAAKAFGKFAGLVWTDVHALNWFVDENLTFWFIEPQNRKLAQGLEDWQGKTIRFFIGR